MTELAYLVDMDAAYVREFRARVTALPPGGAVLDRTYFYPTGGGQPSDRGSLLLASGERLEVTDVSRSGSSVVHRLKGDRLRDLKLDLEVGGSLDWERRHRHMRLHTAQHLLSARIFTRTGFRTRRASLEGTRALLDLEGVVPAGEVSALESDLRDALDHPRPVTILQLPRKEYEANPATRSGLVPLPANIDPVRVVQIAGLDVCACGGTHVRSTGELGLVTLAPPAPLTGGGSRVVLTLSTAPSATPAG